MTSWVVQIFAISDVRAEELIVGLLGGITDVVVQRAGSGGERYVVTECGDVAQAHSIRRIVTSIDFDARLVHITSGPPEVMSGKVPVRMA